ncbi:MAG: hypothetical protein J0M23_05000 [Rickettsiales bacterium]|nr:hypothetical protein [Rickettsiales bacterium]
MLGTYDFGNKSHPSLYFRHNSRKSLEIYSRLSITDAQKKYNEVINNFPI